MTPSERDTIRKIFAGLEWWDLVEVGKDLAKIMDYKANKLEERVAFENIMKGTWQ